MPRLTAKQMAAHVAAVCKENRIVIGSHSRGGRAWRVPRGAPTDHRGRINIRPVKSAVTYAVALHEIGHVLGKWQSRPRLESEAGAWLWARENARCWTPRMDATMRKAMDSYLAWARARQDRKHGRPVLPPSHHAFWLLINPPPTAPVAPDGRFCERCGSQTYGGKCGGDCAV
jgi:hypothetical protein